MKNTAEEWKFLSGNFIRHKVPVNGYWKIPISEVTKVNTAKSRAITQSTAIANFGDRKALFRNKEPCSYMIDLNLGLLIPQGRLEHFSGHFIFFQTFPLRQK
jgi:hypothetical protein